MWTFVDRLIICWKTYYESSRHNILKKEFDLQLMLKIFYSRISLIFNHLKKLAKNSAYMHNNHSFIRLIAIDSLIGSIRVNSY